MIAFLDSNTLIYFFEGADQYRAAVSKELAKLQTRFPDLEVAVSRLGVMECRVKPLREGNQALLAQYDVFFELVQIVELTSDVVDLATTLRAKTPLKTPDALQAACALSLDSPYVFITSDKEFSRVKNLQILMIKV